MIAGHASKWALDDGIATNVIALERARSLAWSTAACSWTGTTESSDAFQGLQLWQPIEVRPYLDALSVQSTLGRPALFETPRRTEFAGFNTEIVPKLNVAASPTLPWWRSLRVSISGRMVRRCFS